MAIENFGVNTLIIPMDVAYQDNGMFKAYGLVYNLLSNGIPVKWSILPGKAFNGTDFTATAQDLQSATPVVNHNYSGGPFIIDSAFQAQALPFITAWQLLYPNVKVHRATAPFSAPIASTMNRKPRIAVEATNSGIMTNYLNVASIPDSNGNTWPNASPDILSETEIAQGALFGYDLTQCRRISYDVFLSPHTGDSTWDDPNLKIELNDYLRLGGFFHATCHSVPSVENTAGPFLTQAGIPTTDDNGGDTSTFTVDVPDFPSAQAVVTGLPQGLPGGSFQTVYHLTPGLIYNAQTQVLAHFIETNNNKQYDFMIAGPYKNGAGAGKIVYEGGHNYSPNLPYTNNMENLYYRFVLDSIFFSVSKPLMYLEFTPQTLFSNIINTINFSVVNTGASPAPNTSFSVTLVPGMTYNGDATIPPTSIVGQTLNWSSAALDTVQPGVVLTFTADFIPPAPVPTKLADFSTSFGDDFDETYSLDHCVSAQVEVFEMADLEVVKAVDKAFATVNDTLTYTVTITNNGVLPATNVVFKDVIPAGATFVPGSVTVAVPPGLPIPTPGDPSVGIPLPDIQPAPAPGSTVVVTFQVTVDDVLVPIDIVNKATVNYSFTNNQGTFNSIANSNEVTTQIEIGMLNADKSADKTVATVGDVITYTVVVSNTGTVTANNVVFTDNPPNGTTFVPGSVTVDGMPTAGNPTAGIPLGSIPVGGSKTVTFKVTVSSIPAPPTTINTANIDFTYRANPQGPDLPGFTVSNPVIIDIVSASLTLLKSSDKSSVEVGDVITYSITVTNTGTITANNVVLTEPIPAGTTFIPGSVTLDGIPTPGNPSAGIPLGNMAPGASITMAFKVTATSIPVPNPTVNIATAQGTFTINPGEPPRTLDFDSNQVAVKIEEAMVSVVKSVDKDFAEVGDILTYTVLVTNTGTVPANNTVFTDFPPNGTSFVPGSVTINALPAAGDPSLGIPLGNIPAGGFVTVTFKVTIDSIPVPNPLTNVAIIDADFPVDPNDPVSKTFNSNPVDTKVEIAELDTVKSVDKAFAEVGDTLTYTVIIKNTGSVVANNVIFTDVPPNGTTFITSSVTINGIPNGLANPTLGINVGSIPAGASVTVSFKVSVDFVPVPNPISNIAIIQATFPVDPQNPITKNFTSNPAETKIEIARLDMIKSADKQIVEVGDVVTFTVQITNTGTVIANNVIFKDTPPNGTSFVVGSVTINGVPDLLADPALGFNVGNIPAGGMVTVVFKVTVDAIPVPNPTINIAAAQGTFPIDPNNPIQKDFESNPLPIDVEQAKLDVVKSTDKSYAEIGETVTYTVKITNSGTIVANNVIFKDLPPSGTTFIPGSVTLNGVPIPGNPAGGINIGSIPVGTTVTVAFKVNVVSIPVPNPTINIASVDASFPIDHTKPPVVKNFPSNPVDLSVIKAELDAVKSVNKFAAVVGDTLTYTVKVSNTGNVSTDAVMFDLVPVGTVFVPNSIKIDGIAVPGADPNNGVGIGTIAPGQSKTISFDVTVITLPDPPEVVNFARIEFEYIVNPDEPPRSKEVDTNAVLTRIEEVGLELIKSADKDYVIKGDIITYTVAIKNTGTVPLNNVIFKDPIPNGTSFVENSFKIDGVVVPGANPENGVNIGTVNPGQTINVSFSVKYEFRPCPPIIRNLSFAEFNYRIVSSGPVETGVAESNQTETEAAPTNFKQLSVDEDLTIPCQKPDAEDILDAVVNVEIVQTRLIKTMIGTSAEGQILTGYKLIIEGVLHQKVEYVANEPTQTVHAAEFNTPFSSFIILPQNFTEDTLIKVDAYVEDVYIKLIDKRHIFKNVTLRIEADIIC